MVYDINSPGESTRIISKLMQWTDDRQIHIHTILHQNKGDENARGHIGTELNNKAETVLLVEKDKGNGDISSVSAMHIRAMDFEPFAFRINDSALPELIENYKPESRKPGRPEEEKFDPYRHITEQQHLTIIGAGNQAGGADAANLLKPALARGELRTIAATTWSEYKQYFELSLIHI